MTAQADFRSLAWARWRHDGGDHVGLCCCGEWGGLLRPAWRSSV